MNEAAPRASNGSVSAFHRFVDEANGISAADNVSVVSDAVPELVNGSSSGLDRSAADNGSGSRNDLDETTTEPQQSTDGFNGVDGLKSPYLKPTDADSVHDLVCIGFGPASLAIAVALHDAMDGSKLANPPKVLFLEKQAQFAWHAGMLLPGAKMQISFIKDLASLRDPRSHFTFLNYLHQNGRLVEFTNLGTFLPARVEYEDYLRWCARHFDDVVLYQSEVVSVSPVQQSGPHRLFNVASRNAKTGVTTTFQTRNVILAVGGQPSIPQIIPAQSPRVIHSSQYAQLVPKILSDASRSYRVAVVGAGQSAAEIFNNVQSLYPNSKTWMIMRSDFLKPSDDSPFVNSIFNPEFIDTVYPLSSAHRASLLADARATNYGVVRLELIEHLYEKMYHQRRTLGTDEKKWPHRIMGGRRIVTVGEKDDQLSVKVALCTSDEETQDGPLLGEEVLDVDLIICATGYQRKAHLEMLKDTWSLLPEVASEKSGPPATTRDHWFVDTETADTTSTRVLEVGRDYGVRFSPGTVASGSGVWLQGCCEATHGLSDTLLSVLGTRSGEIVESIFGNAAEPKWR
ncbi:L-lysine 6-monooxygenase (NADPH-requiring)-domain-containing protein [Lasiosphaeria miniovina]|uniref:L-ornithine N(5)-monooxygenase [NAD(P)H] n=1 Tax=Lasiosphaeria miniovina TaxID=1954250 RepID=A0AA40A6P0_9PEZI|nr:L-lysine 6-monooxygenase (NADPH-requiring)-domain-containing protein [Lasiosphaeria miniovina]KAK0710306.1 L-lysine 6-monooxygenase (NADPH-requiring)-domain-containing protein [Lasiosphaeria miniovina]